MIRGIAISGGQTKGKLRIVTPKQRVIAVKSIIVYLERIRDAAIRHPAIAPQSYALTEQRYEAEYFAEIIDEAIYILEIIQ